MSIQADRTLDDLWESGTVSVLVHVVLNDLGLIGSAVRTLHESWPTLSGGQRDELLHLVTTAADRGVDRLRLLALHG